MLLEMGRRAEALQAWEHCLTLSPQFQQARREMEKVRGLCHVPLLSHHTGTCPCPLKDSTEGSASTDTRRVLWGKKGAWQPSHLLAFSS